MKTASYKLTPAAEADLENIWRYTVSAWGINQANTHIRELDSAFSLLAQNPLACRERSEFSPPVRIYPHAHHLVVYLAAEQCVVIVRVLHENMDIETHLETL